ncbi:uncharacterized protein PGTG_00690 [Puccinia graminis f. sp. tritici CRL 75-36-700-3]|uniref:EF-hand domain-containing protein n=1 Tax=Puccinia graminis f. sp. tritici (strain CRL 75-36-700-3 / race SCCL) TaxID=418459 RepID=E3JR68_PUCGT|nr:uncharacterized protein PGTG_00690 [Puccinia graminis f. sp. tritici CRL 75-36-700-3]EFP74734.2 hypothetical protein PGTG_00690 [Puccinia graminis f. sp. tritici CRL 75-36-700-3]
MNKSVYYSPLFLILSSLMVCSIDAHSSHNDSPADPSADFLTVHMDKEHHIQGFDLESAFHLHDLNSDNILEASEILKLYGVDHETAIDQSLSVDHHNSVASRILSEVMEKLDLNQDGLITKSEFVSVVSRDGLPKFDDISGLGHHYDEEGEYFLHHEEMFHNSPDSQKEEAYIHPEDIEHFTHHEEIEVKEDELARLAQGLPADVNTLEYRKMREEHAQLEQERERRVDAVRAQAAKYNSIHLEAQRRGSWNGFKKPVDQADRLRKNIPYKYKLRKPFFGEF